MSIHTLKLDDAFASALEKVSLTKTNVAENILSHVLRRGAPLQCPFSGSE